MGISGLLPALKSIQVTKHLSEYKGQTVAVDAYVWLHKGVYACATELATGKPTNKYVKYAIERVRLLRYHGIEPYIVFDGGPLPAKQGTESERKQKREENISRGHMLTSQGKHSQARECYAKCVDVTPQMAFQFIKALRAEGVKYVVAPYEADAQLAFLERTGIVSAILTEDSDLLVFGCKNVLFKLDTVARTVVSISTDNFASVTDSNSISLLGWSAKQFREMAILSGCDYLPSIPGVGLKTACTLLRRWKTPDQVVRAIALDGKKTVPKGYLTQFRLADRCFLYQRVYHPGLERLVHLNDLPPDEEWDEIVDAFVGSDMDPLLAKAIAVGEKDPVSRLAMVDINPGFAPSSRVLQEVPIVTKQLNRPPKGKGKARDRPASEGILSFFGPNPKIPLISKSPSISRPKIAPKPLIVGKDSGKRTLAELHGQDLAARKKKRMTASPTKPTQTVSRFFGSSGMKKEDKPAFQDDSETPVAGSSRVHDEKENEYIVTDDEDEDSEGAEGNSLIAQGHSDVDLEVEMVEQEDGYMSPISSCSRDIQDLSSPPRPSTAPLSRRTSSDAFEFGAEAVSSPPSRGRSYGRLRTPHATTAVSRSRERVLVESTPEIEVRRSGTVQMLDLKDSFGEEAHSDIDWSGDETASPTPSPLTPDDLTGQDRDLTSSITAVEGEDLEDPEEQEQKSLGLRSAAVAAGWKNVWSFGSTRVGQGASALLRRSDTNVTPMGRHKLGAADTQRKAPSRAHPYLHGHAPAFTHSSASCSDSPLPETLKARRSLVFVEETKTVKAQAFDTSEIQPSTLMSHSTESGHPSVSAKSRLESFRFIHR